MEWVLSTKLEFWDFSTYSKILNIVPRYTFPQTDLNLDLRIIEFAALFQHTKPYTMKQFGPSKFQTIFHVDSGSLAYIDI